MIRAHNSGTDHPGTNAPPATLNADLALLFCCRAWTGLESTETNRSPWLGLEPAWRDRLLGIIETSDLPEPAAALELLRQAHRLQCHAELDHVHASWWIRALQDESPAVRRAIAAHGPPRVRSAAREALNLDAAHLPDPPPGVPEAIGWVLALWTERLVGGEPVGENDPPVIVALAGLPAPQLFRLCHAAGLAKTALAADPRGPGGRPVERERNRWFLDWFGHHFGTDEAQTQARKWARRDLERARRLDGSSPRRSLASVGLKTIATLLARCEPYRIRWALQHVPYPVAKRIRSLMTSTAVDSEHHQYLEEVVLQAAWHRLELERRLAWTQPDEPPRTDHAG